MPSLSSLPFLAKLNAPTRAAAANRRRLRKLAAACLTFVAAVLILSSLRPAAGTIAANPTHAAGLEAAAKKGVPISIPVPAYTAAAVTPGSHVDVWDASGRKLATRLLVLESHSAGGSRTSLQVGSDIPTVVVIADRSETPKIIQILSTSRTSDQTKITLTKNFE